MKVLIHRIPSFQARKALILFFSYLFKLSWCQEDETQHGAKWHNMKASSRTGRNLTSWNQNVNCSWGVSFVFGRKPKQEVLSQMHNFKKMWYQWKLQRNCAWMSHRKEMNFLISLLRKNRDGWFAKKKSPNSIVLKFHFKSGKLRIGGLPVQKETKKHMPFSAFIWVI